jgi:8-oxo-dGTP diphosphatase
MRSSPEQYFAQVGTALMCPVAIIMKDKKVLMGLRHYTADKWKQISVWTIPGGRCDEGELVEQTLRRETYEETGIRNITIGEYLGEVPGAKEGDHVLLFVATTTEEPTLMEPEKFSEWRWFAADELPEQFINPEALKVIRSELSG